MGPSLLLSIKVRNEEEVNEVIAACTDVGILDNIEGEEHRSVAHHLCEHWADSKHSESKS